MFGLGQICLYDPKLPIRFSVVAEFTNDQLDPSSLVQIISRAQLKNDRQR
jgi:hypothetical protein